MIQVYHTYGLYAWLAWDLGSLAALWLWTRPRPRYPAPRVPKAPKARRRWGQHDDDVVAVETDWS